MKLKRCPFCGAHPHTGMEKRGRCQLHGEPIQNHYVRCPRHCAGASGPSLDIAITQWNTRVREEDP